MAGTTMTPPLGGGFPGQSAVAGKQLSASAVNSYRVTAVAERLATHFGAGQGNNPQEFFNLCLSLARGIDYAVANNQVPETIRTIPTLLKKICLHRNDLFLQAAIMVLMISVKNACKMGWFSEKEKEELFNLANEIGSSFCSPGGMNTEANHSLSTISTIMTRFYPLMKMGHILASLEVKPGYGAYVTDFNISKQTAHSPEEKIRLLVAQKDNIESSTCIISPQLVNFLLNGKAVERRTNVSMDPGPQLPTNVTPILKYGTNLLQAVGQFNGHYIIVVAFMSMTPLPDTPVLQPYVQPAVASLDPDSDIIEGPSRISLNCPISYKRIKTPVKGLSCKHLQCFDFSNFVDINSRRPSWRCPHCNQYICYPDIRVDQNMDKVLREVGDNVVDVIISADGSWKAVMETDENVDEAHALNSEQQEPSSTSNALPTVLDLTKDDDEEMTAADTYVTEDIKPFQTNLHCQSALPNLPSLNNQNGVNQNVDAQVEDDFWSCLYLAASNAESDAQILGGISQSRPIPANSLSAPLLTDAISHAHALNQEYGVRGSTSLSTSVTNCQYSAANNLHLQPSQLVNSIVSNEYGRSPSIPRHVTRTPVAIQALPAQSQIPNSQQRSRPSVNLPILNSSGLASQTTLTRAHPTANGSNTVSGDIERQQHLSRSHMNAIQNRDNQERSLIPGQSGQQQAYRATSTGLTEFENSHLQHTFNRRMHHQSTSHSPSSVRSSPHAPQTQVQQGGAATGDIQLAKAVAAAQRADIQLAKAVAAAQRAAIQMTRQSQTVPVQVQTSRAMPSSSVRASAGEQRNMGGLVQSVPRTDGLVDMPSEQNWRPTGRMRGSLVGPAYSAALSQFMMQPTQPAQATRPSNLTSPLPNHPALPSVLVANSRNSHDPQRHNKPTIDPASSMPGGSSVQPEQSHGMH